MKIVQFDHNTLTTQCQQTQNQCSDNIKIVVKYMNDNLSIP